VPGSSQGFSLTQIRDLYSIPNWHPDDHPAMPEIVAQGHKPDVFACGYCHLPNGLGRAENSSLAGLPAVYIEQQLADYRSGARGTAKPQRGPPKLMIANSKQVTEADVREAARYFAALPLTRWVRVVEAEMVPKTRVAAGALLPSDGGMEALGERIIELPENLELFDLRDARSGFVAYVPAGSVAKGRELVANGAGGVPCETCHGAGLHGAGPIPGIAGRSPSYTVRQLYDLQHGIRAGAWSALMASQVAKLTINDMVAIAAYTASLPP
jgi:cytochrome c553